MKCTLKLIIAKQNLFKIPYGKAGNQFVEMTNLLLAGLLNQISNRGQFMTALMLMPSYC